MKFKKGELSKESYKVIMRDIQLLKDNQGEKDFNYYYNLVVDNLNDIWGDNENNENNENNEKNENN